MAIELDVQAAMWAQLSCFRKYSLAQENTYEEFYRCIMKPVEQKARQ